MHACMAYYNHSDPTADVPAELESIIISHIWSAIDHSHTYVKREGNSNLK